MTAVEQVKNWWAFKKAMWRWWWEMPFIGDPRWGSGPQRRKNLDIAMDRHDAKQPHCEDFGIRHRYIGGEDRCCRCYALKSRA